MAANIQEALELGCKTLLIDEDSSATNLLVRDQRMQALIKAEPITPFVSKARALFAHHGVSTLIVVGGCGDYLSIADTVIGMQSYLPNDLTAAAKQVVARYPTAITEAETYGPVPDRKITLPAKLLGSKPPASRGKDYVRLFSQPKNVVNNPAESETGIELFSVEQFVEPGQVRLVTEVLRWVNCHASNQSVKAIMDRMENVINDKGLDGLHIEGHEVGDLVAARRYELGSALNRLRGCNFS